MLRFFFFFLFSLHLHFWVDEFYLRVIKESRILQGNKMSSYIYFLLLFLASGVSFVTCGSFPTNEGNELFFFLFFCLCFVVFADLGLVSGKMWVEISTLNCQSCVTWCFSSVLLDLSS